MNVALELGVREFRSLRREGQRLIGRRTPCAYVALPQGAAERKLLDQARISYSACQGSLLVLGHAAVDLARSLKIPCLSPFEENRLPKQDVIARQVAASLIDSVLPPGNPSVDRCCLTVPGIEFGDLDSHPSEGTVSTGATLEQFVKLRGYNTTSRSASYAVGLSELGRDRLTGVAIHFGAGKCQASLLQRGVELLQAGIPRGEDAVINQWARNRKRFLWDHEGHCYLHQTAVREWKEQRQPSLERPVDEDERVWKECVEELLIDLMSVTASGLVGRIGATVRRQPMSIVCEGALCALPGFEPLMHRVMEALGWPTACRELRIAADSNFAVTRGLLIHAESLSETAQPRNDAA